MGIFGYQPNNEPPMTGLPKSEPAMCRNCGKRPGVLQWVGDGGALAYVHGGGAPWCERCVVEAQLAYAKVLAARIPELEQKLSALPE